MNTLVHLITEEERLRRSALTRPADYRKAYWQLLVERWKIYEMGEDAVPGLALALKRIIRRRMDRQRANEAIHMLTVIGDESATILGRVAEKPDIPHRGKVVEALGRLGQKGGTELVRLLEEKADGKLDKAGVIAAIEYARHASAMGVLEKLTLSEDPRERYFAYKAMASLGAKKELVKFVDENNDFDRLDFREILVRSRSNDMARKIIEKIEASPNANWAPHAITLLGEIGGSAASKFLMENLKKKPPVYPVPDLVEAIARMGEVRHVQKAMKAARELSPGQMEKAFLALLYYASEPAYTPIYSAAGKGNDRYAGIVIRELAKRGLKGTKAVAKNMATKGEGVTLIYGIRALAYFPEKNLTKKLFKDFLKEKERPGGYIDAILELVGAAGLVEAIARMYGRALSARRTPSPAMAAALISGFESTSAGIRSIAAFVSPEAASAFAAMIRSSTGADVSDSISPRTGTILPDGLSAIASRHNFLIVVSLSSRIFSACGTPMRPSASIDFLTF